MITPDMLARNGTEHGEQCAVFCWAAQNLERLPMLQWIHAIPNGGKRDKITAGRLKAEGVKAGVADIFLPYPRIIRIQALNHEEKPCGTPFYRTFHGLYVEMKRATGKMSDVSQEQAAFQHHCDDNGYVWVAGFGWQMAVQAIERYILTEVMFEIDDESRR